MTRHIILGYTIGMADIIKKLKMHGVTKTFIVDYYHEGDEELADNVACFSLIQGITLL